ncbi:MAG TPA: ATP-dependent DNA helicase UvrD2 [Acidimicrobiia bacterium]|nr:ATP-dependent DNA helicase UvrD2 [Acidimicrobiia bacterium]
MARTIPYPGPLALGRGLVVEADDPLPGPAAGWPSLTIGTDAVAGPGEALELLDGWWRSRTPSVVVLEVPFSELKASESTDSAPYLLTPLFEFARERLHFLVWVNRYDGRGGTLRWHHAERSLGIGAETCLDESGDVTVGGRPVWIDGGPRTHSVDGLAIVHVESVWSGRLEPDRTGGPESELAPDQLESVSHPGGPARIIAPAGSGKTRVLTERMRHLIVDRRWNSDSVTALAYNRRAAGEMTNRLADSGSTHVRTLHAFGYEILGRARSGRPRLLGEREVRRLLDRLAPIRPRANEDVHAPYLEGLAEIRTALRSPDEVEGDRDDAPGLAAIFGPYREALANQGAIDHDEQIYGAVEALLQNAPLRAWAQSRCRHLLVDEFQDLTPAHLLLVRLLAAPGYDVFGVGDDDQVIYGYAGASPEFLIDYADYFPGAAHHQLVVNYRCPAPVVEAATNLLGYNQRRIPKKVESASTASHGLEVVRAAERDMGEQLVSVVGELIERAGAPSVAVLARVNVGLLVPQVALAEAGIPADSVLDASLLQRSGVRSALAWLRIASVVAQGEPISGSDLDEATRRPPRGLSPGVRTALARGMWTIERLGSFAAGATDDRIRSRLEGLVDDIEALASGVEDGMGIADLLVFIRDQVGLGTVLDRLDNSRARPTGGHTDDLDALVMLAHTHPEVEAFEPWLRSSLERTSPRGEGVTLSTVHRVKGLEWPHVVVWDVSTGLMPHRLAIDVEEERRIFHVAVTRCSESVTVIARASATSPFVGQLHRPAPEPTREKVTPLTVTAETGMRLRWQGFAAVISDLEDDAAVVTIGSTSRMRIRWGETVSIDGRRVRLTAPPGPSADPALLEALKEWRRRRSAADGVPPYVVAHDAHLQSIASRHPTSLQELGRCEGIGPARLDRYGDEILEIVNAER